jgi:precorrin-6x reductase
MPEVERFQAKLAAAESTSRGSCLYARILDVRQQQWNPVEAYACRARIAATKGPRGWENEKTLAEFPRVCRRLA